MVGMYKNVWISVLLAKYTHCSLCNKQFRKREFNFSGSLQMVRVKMSPLTILLAEKKRKRRNEEKSADPFTFFSRPHTRAQFFFSFFSLLYITCMETTIEAKTLWYRASSDDAFFERVCSSFFCMCVYVLCAQAYVTPHFFLIFFLRASLTYHGQNKRKARPLSLFLLYSYIYTYATKVI